MDITYKTRYSARCPFNEVMDYYDIEIKSKKMIRTEHIAGKLEGHEGRKISQEELTKYLSECFPEAEIILVGFHSGIKTTSRMSSITSDPNAEWGGGHNR